MKINLNKIDLSKSDGCKHSDILSGRDYLAVYNGKKIIGQFYKQWHGWNFDWFWSGVVGIQLDSLSEVYEIDFVE